MEADVDGRGGWETTRRVEGEDSPSADLGRVFVSRNNGVETSFKVVGVACCLGSGGP